MCTVTVFMWAIAFIVWAVISALWANIVLVWDGHQISYGPAWKKVAPLGKSQKILSPLDKSINGLASIGMTYSNSMYGSEKACY